VKSFDSVDDAFALRDADVRAATTRERTARGGDRASSFDALADADARAIATRDARRLGPRSRPR
jgi:hypothetical protein